MPLQVLTPDLLTALPDLARDRPDLHLTLPGARLSLWWQATPPWPGHRLGLVGHFAADSERDARALLEEGCRRLALAGCTLAVGPMDGSTWRRYRLVTDPGTEAPFALEPTNPTTWPTWWQGAGFTPFQTYQSALERRLEAADPRLARVEARLQRLGVTLQPLDPAAFEAGLDAIHEVSELAFQDNVLYTPLDREAFRELYRPIQPHVLPGLVWLATQGGAGGPRPVGFVFTLPDLLEAARGEPPTTLIVKTLAKVPDPRLGGLGALLLARVQDTARNMGFTRAIHALMHDHNSSRNMAQDAAVIRRYTLFGRAL